MAEFRFVKLEDGGIGLEDVNSPGDGYSFKSYAEAISFVQGRPNWQFLPGTDEEAHVRFDE